MKNESLISFLLDGLGIEARAACGRAARALNCTV